ncbi:hypothetical protein, partial [Bifidobacterium aquikefiri]
SREISSLRASTAKIPRLAPLARDDNGVVVHTTDSLRSLGMTGEEHGIDWNELHADTPAET